MSPPPVSWTTPVCRRPVAHARLASLRPFRRSRSQRRRRSNRSRTRPLRRRRRSPTWRRWPRRRRWRPSSPRARSGCRASTWRWRPTPAPTPTRPRRRRCASPPHCAAPSAALALAAAASRERAASTAWSPPRRTSRLQRSVSTERRCPRWSMRRWSCTRCTRTRRRSSARPATAATRCHPRRIWIRRPRAPVWRPSWRQRAAPRGSTWRCPLQWAQLPVATLTK
mmetsp:Transcript_41398/g.104034  ORF Transcript_41398/g.104034 Transcript_41398/m.104034 type:complete len:225 (-) Transcript_41398:137-811(-)